MPKHIDELYYEIEKNRIRERQKKRQQCLELIRIYHSIDNLSIRLTNIDRRIADLNNKVYKIESELDEVIRKTEVVEEKRYKSDRKYLIWIIVLCVFMAARSQATILSGFQLIIEYILKCLGSAC